MKPRIFISAVARELKSAWQLVANTLLALGYELIWQDVFETSAEVIRLMHANGAEFRWPRRKFIRCSISISHK